MKILSDDEDRHQEEKKTQNAQRITKKVCRDQVHAVVEMLVAAARHVVDLADPIDFMTSADQPYAHAQHGQTQ